MTLLEMIKKYEKLREKMFMAQQKEDEEIVKAILEDLESVAKCVECISKSTLYAKVLKQIDKAINNDDPDGAHSWMQTLQMLSD